MTFPTEEATSVPITYCYRHPGREALVRCVRCERPICPDCMRPASVGFHCPDDVARARRSTRASRTSVGARLRHTPPLVTAALVTANIVVYIVTGLQSTSGLGHPDNAPINGLFFDWQLQPYAVFHTDAYYRLITSGFLHVSLLHIGANMLALAIVGPPLERLVGRWRFAALYLLALLGGSVAVYAFGNALQPVVGASGAVFGLFAACLVMVRRLGLDLQWLVGIIVLNFVFTFSVSDVSKLGHLGGFVAGGLAAFAIAGLPRLRARLPWWAQTGGLSGVLALEALVVAVRSLTF
jgi:membrane associated rhomboid family serine protease